jgi:hypothetical protein
MSVAVGHVLDVATPSTFFIAHTNSRFEVFLAVKIHVRTAALCGVVIGYQRFGGPFCLHLHDPVDLSICVNKVYQRLGFKLLSHLRQEAENCGPVHGVAKTQLIGDLYVKFQLEDVTTL